MHCTSMIIFCMASMNVEFKESMICSHLVVELGMETSMGRRTSSLASCKGCMLVETVQRFMLAKKWDMPMLHFFGLSG